MNCPNCNTWNPDDKTLCWRCQAELPRPVQKAPKRQRTLLGFPMWFWLSLVGFFVLTSLAQCFFAPTIGQ